MFIFRGVNKAQAEIYTRLFNSLYLHDAGVSASHALSFSKARPRWDIRFYRNWEHMISITSKTNDSALKGHRSSSRSHSPSHRSPSPHTSSPHTQRSDHTLANSSVSIPSSPPAAKPNSTQINSKAGYARLTKLRTPSRLHNRSLRPSLKQQHLLSRSGTVRKCADSGGDLVGETAEEGDEAGGAEGI